MTSLHGGSFCLFVISVSLALVLGLSWWLERSCVPDCCGAFECRPWVPPRMPEALDYIEAWYCICAVRCGPGSRAGAHCLAGSAHARWRGGADVTRAGDLNSCQPLPPWEVLRAVCGSCPWPCVFLQKVTPCPTGNSTGGLLKGKCFFSPLSLLITSLIACSSGGLYSLPPLLLIIDKSPPPCGQPSHIRYV